MDWYLVNARYRTYVWCILWLGRQALKWTWKNILIQVHQIIQLGTFNLLGIGWDRKSQKKAKLDQK